MLPVKSQYKIAKRLGPIFEKTQSQKFALSEARVKKSSTGKRGASDFGRQQLEKQRVRFTYGITERQLSRYVKEAYALKNPAASLYRTLEMRADGVMYRSGFAPTRRAARQMVSHGHITINGKKVRVPSYNLRKGDVLSVREGSRKAGLFSTLGKGEGETRAIPPWLDIDASVMNITVVGDAEYKIGESPLDLSAVFEFYSR